MAKYQRPTYCGILREAGRGEDQRIVDMIYIYIYIYI
jgi:hypothetical protein